VRIATVSNLYPPFTIGGYERLCGDVCSELAMLGHPVSVLTSGYGGKAPDPPGQSVSRRLRLLANESNIYEPASFSEETRRELVDKNSAALRSFLKRVRPDVVFAWNLYFLGAEFVSELMSQRIPVVAFLTDNWLIAAENPSAIGEFFTRFVHGPETYAAGARLSGGADRRYAQTAIYGSQFMLDLHRSAGFLFEHERIIHHGVRLPMVPRELRAKRDGIGKSGAVRLLFAGRVVDVKGPQVLLAALPRIRLALAPLDVKLTIVGDRQDVPFLQSLEAQVAGQDLGDVVTFALPVAEDELLSLFNDHDIFVFPSLYEPFSLTLIHALASGIPTVASDAGGNVEIVSHERTGLVFERLSADQLAAAVVRLCTDADLRDRISETAIRVAHRFTFRRMIERLERELGASRQTLQPVIAD
jgi:glycosyltransferase involved in cell wall biosynthesis